MKWRRLIPFPIPSATAANSGSSTVNPSTAWRKINLHPCFRCLAPNSAAIRSIQACLAPVFCGGFFLRLQLGKYGCQCIHRHVMLLFSVRKCEDRDGYIRAERGGGWDSQTRRVVSLFGGWVSTNYKTHCTLLGPGCAIFSSGSETHHPHRLAQRLVDTHETQLYTHNSSGTGPGNPVFQPICFVVWSCTSSDKRNLGVRAELCVMFWADKSRRLISWCFKIRFHWVPNWRRVHRKYPIWEFECDSYFALVLFQNPTDMMFRLSRLKKPSSLIQPSARMSYKLLYWVLMFFRLFPSWLMNVKQRLTARCPKINFHPAFCQKWR